MTVSVPSGAPLALLDPAEIVAGLDEDQARICVQTAECDALINAGAGSGKTRLVVKQIAYQIATGLLQPEQIMAITFTNKSARELTERLALSVGPERAQAMFFVGTFHSVCIKLLRRFIRTDLGWPTFHILDEDDQSRMLRAAAISLKLDPDRVDWNTMRRWLTKWKSWMIPPQAALEDATEKNDHVRYTMAQIYGQYQELCRRARGMDFDDILIYTVWALQKQGAMQQFCHQQFRRIVVDEFQDTNMVQARLVTLLRGPNATVIAIGDDRQGIYSFRGANIQNILDFNAHFPKAVSHNLTRNYRSQSVIVDAAEELIKGNPEQLPKICVAMNPRGSLIQIRSAFDDGEEATWIAQMISKLVVQEGYAYDEIAILYRMNFISRLLEGELMARQIPYQIVGGTHFFGRREVRDLLAMVRVAFNPRDDAAILRLLELRPGVGKTSVDAYIAYAAEHKVSLVDSLQNLKVRSHTAKPQAMLLLDYLSKLQVAIMALPLPSFLNWARTAFGHDEVLERAEQNGPDALMSRKQNIQELIRVAGQLQEQVKGSQAGVRLLDMALQAEGEQRREGVQLMTAHASKGLEFDVVFLAAFAKDVFPTKNSQIAEERRLAYVAMTRAKKRLFISHAASGYGSGGLGGPEASLFLSELPAEFLQYLR